VERERVQDAAAFLVKFELPAGPAPSVATLHRVFQQLDVAKFEARPCWARSVATGGSRTERTSCGT